MYAEPVSLVDIFGSTQLSSSASSNLKLITTPRPSFTAASSARLRGYPGVFGELHVKKNANRRIPAGRDPGGDRQWISDR